MTERYSGEWAEGTVEGLRGVGVEFGAGMTAGELEAIEGAFEVAVPAELAQFLTTGVPVSAKWARWTEGPEAVAADARAWIDGTFTVAITAGWYWHPLFGERPGSDAGAVEQALEVVHGAAPLIPVYGHRFITTSSAGAGPVLSVWQVDDSIVYGNDLGDYFAREFGIERPTWAATEPGRVPVWDELFDL